VKGEGVTIGAAGWTAVALFALVTVVTMAMFVSVGGLSFTLQREENETLLALPATEMSAAATYREFASRLERNFRTNAQKMRFYFRGMWILCGLVGAEAFVR